LTDPGPGGRFERHPRLTGAGLVLLALVVLELGLRVAAPRPLRFAHEMRRVHGYSRVARVDLRPSQSAALRIDRADGAPLFDFRLTTGPDAFRIEENAPPPQPGGRFVHAIGDSYTMGWGVSASDSYPARLAAKLGPELHVLNLGVDGFGSIGATAKSRALADRYPPVHAVYLFSPNDPDDDRRALDVAQRSAAAHAAHEALDGLRRASYVAGVPFALRYRVQFGSGAGALASGTKGSETDGAGLEPRVLLLQEPEPAPEPPELQPTFSALRAYRDFLAARGARLSVLVLSNQPESLAAYRFCKAQGIEARLFDVTEALRIPDEGHFNAAGNEAVASLVAGLIASGRDLVER
jgi:lysophospholipase L1-like esterase